jgi:hypothetical protein
LGFHVFVLIVRIYEMVFLPSRSDLVARTNGALLLFTLLLYPYVLLFVLKRKFVIVLLSLSVMDIA